MKRFISLILVILIFMTSLTVSAANYEKTVRILFTHDIHSHFIPSKALIDGELREHGGAARLKTLIENNRTARTVYVDAGDFSMGTLLQAGYSTDAYELRLLGELGCEVTTFGNHEFDYGDQGIADMLKAAKASGDKLPKIVQSNMITEGALTKEQHILPDAMKEYGAEEYTVSDINGVKIAFFGLFGIDCLSCAPTAQVEFENYIEAAKKTVEKIKENENVDLIVCLSHSGTSGDGKNGEDFELAKQVPDINVIISGHTHTKYDTPVMCGKTVVVSAGEYLSYLGVLDIKMSPHGVSVMDYSLIPCDENVEDDPQMLEKVNEYKNHINETYLKNEGVGYDDVICKSDFDFMTLDEMSSTHQEYPFGDLIADSYIYEAKRNGINDIDVALVGLGTIRGTFRKGDITTGQVFEMCSLGVGKDGSAGHPILCAYITGKELKLLVELDASLGPMVSYIKMSYSGLKYTFNTKRALLDRVTDICLVREDGTEEEIEDNKLYKVCCNMYAANMLGMLNGLTMGILKITPKFQNGKTVEDFYDCSLYNKNGEEIKEWVALKNYLLSMPEKNGVPTILEKYAQTQERKNKVSDSDLISILKHPGTITIVLITVPTIILALIIILVATRKKRKYNKVIKKINKIQNLKKEDFLLEKESDKK